jgi:hypothetical protein
MTAEMVSNVQFTVRFRLLAMHTPPSFIHIYALCLSCLPLLCSLSSAFFTLLLRKKERKKEQKERKKAVSGVQLKLLG